MLALLSSVLKISSRILPITYFFIRAFASFAIILNPIKFYAHGPDLFHSALNFSPLLIAISGLKRNFSISFAVVLNFFGAYLTSAFLIKAFHNVNRSDLSS